MTNLEQSRAATAEDVNCRKFRRVLSRLRMESALLKQPKRATQ